MLNYLYDLQFTHWQAILLSALPALLNLFIFFYVKINFPADKTSRVFSLFLLALIIYQLGDTFLRMSRTAEEAILWNSIFCIGILFITPLGFHFSLLFMGRKKLAESFTVQFLIYAPAVVFLLLTFLNKDSSQFSPSNFWTWVYSEGATSTWAIEGYWIGLLGMASLFMLFIHSLRMAKKSVKRKQTIIITTGLFIPLAQGIITQIILPITTGGHSIPLSSTSLTCFSVGILVALKKYNLFSVTDTLKTRTVLEAMTDILVVLSPDKRILFINREGERALGIKQYKKENLRIEDFFTSSNKKGESLNENLLLPALEGKKITNYSTELLTKSGKRIPVVVSATSYKVAMRESQLLLLIHDVSDLTQTEEALAIREQEVKDKSEELNSFFYRTTHDLKGPVASIVGLTQLAKKEPNFDLTTQCLDKIESSAHRLNNILLDFIKIMQIKERTLDVQEINFPNMTDSIIQSVKYSTGQDKVDFKVCIDSEINFYSDEKLVDSILYNLVANAVNYRNMHAEVKSFVHINIHSFGNGIVLKVSDNGIGIKKEIQGKIFNLFFRGNENSKGTGLGLYILKNAISKLDGRIELTSEVGVGTSFTIYIPDLKNSVVKEDELEYLSVS